MVKHQFAYKNHSSDIELSFEIVQSVDLIQAIIMFTNYNPNAIIYSILRCGKPS